MRPSRFLISCGLAAAILACSDDPEAPGDDCADVASVNATVSVGQTVTIDWAPECAVALLLVELDASDQWVIESPGFESDDPDLGNTIEPPVTYGVVPSGAIESQPPETLVVGTTYDVAIWRLIPLGGPLQCALQFGNACLVANPAFVR